MKITTSIYLDRKDMVPKLNNKGVIRRWTRIKLSYSKCCSDVHKNGLKSENVIYLYEKNLGI